MIPAAVGYQCPECVRAHTKATRQNQGPYGGTLSKNPRVTSIVIIAINAAVWGVIQIAGLMGIQEKVVEFLGLLPQGMCMASTTPGSYYPQAHSLTQCLTMPGGEWVPGVADGAWWQLFTSIFTHVAIWHIGVNCLTLWFLGPPLESVLGRVRFLTTYIVAGLFGSLSVYWLAPPDSFSYGGSGSLFGLMGALLVILWKQKGDVRQLLMWLGLNIVITFVGGASISWQAHLGGLVGGALIACIWAFVPPSAHRGRTQWILIGAALIIIIAGLIARTFILA